MPSSDYLNLWSVYNDIATHEHSAPLDQDSDDEAGVRTPNSDECSDDSDTEEPDDSKGNDFNKKLVRCALIGVGIAALPGLVVAPALGLAGLAGFSSIGPVAGSAAAAYQSAFGATAAFSFVQSAAMGGYGLAAATSAVQGAALVGGVGSGVGAVVSLSRSNTLARFFAYCARSRIWAGRAADLARVKTAIEERKYDYARLKTMSLEEWDQMGFDRDVLQLIGMSLRRFEKAENRRAKR